MKDHEILVDKLARTLMVAARNQVAVGAIYDPSEDLVPKDPLTVWRGVASSLVNIVEAAVREGKELAKDDEA